MSTSHNSCCLPSVKKQKHDFQVFASNYNKTIITFGFCDISRTMKVLVKVISLSLRPSASTDNPYLNIDYSGYHKNRM